MQKNGQIDFEHEKERDAIFIEYGAGRAGLSSFVAERIYGNLESKGDKEAAKSIKFIIVDRDTRRRKLDKNFRENFPTFREKMDIADFDLEKFIKAKKEEMMENEQTPQISANCEILCIAKHLCGGATDLSLTSILEKCK